MDRSSEKFASVIGSEQAEPANIVIFGATGDLTKRKLLPALAHMHCWNLLGHHSRIIGTVRTDWTKTDWVHYVHEQLEHFFPDATIDPSSWEQISQKLDLVVGDLSDPATYQRLGEALHGVDGVKNAIFYLAIPPSWYGCVAENLHKAGLADEREGFRRIVIEKPFGVDLHSAQELNTQLQQHFSESQIYRIDHYLGKESVQNLMVFRFANAVLEPLWNRNYIDHIQITVAESLGIGYRAGYYDKSGALRDMIQSHLLQVMALVAMEPPVSLHADDIRDEKLKALRAVCRMDEGDVDRLTCRAQYAAGVAEGVELSAYRDEQGVADHSLTETFAAIKFHINNWRWRGVPFLLRTGKALPERVSEICIRFKSPPHMLFGEDQPIRNNELIFRLQPDEGMVMNMTAKRPGLSTALRNIQMDARYGLDGTVMPTAYETLFHDALLGDAGLFSRADEVEECWKIVKPIMTRWAQQTEITSYAAGTYDIDGMDALLDDCEGGWRKLDGVHHD